MKKIGVVLSGCGVYDGSEIHEAVLALLAIDRQGCEAVCMAPNIDVPVVNHLTRQETGEKRNVLVESARIARGNIRDIKGVTAADLDAIVFPGGFGAAKNLCDFAVKGAAASVNPEVARLLKEMATAKKPIGAVCIAPTVVAAVLGRGIFTDAYDRQRSRYRRRDREDRGGASGVSGHRVRGGPEEQAGHLSRLYAGQPHLRSCRRDREVRQGSGQADLAYFQSTSLFQGERMLRPYFLQGHTR